MKILDRYVVITFVKNYLISFFVLVGMYVILDMVFNFDELVEVQEKAGTAGVETAIGVVRAAADYYAYQMAVFFVHLSGMIPVVAAAFTLIRLSRFNELSAMLAAGVPLLRVAAPIVIVGLVLNTLLVLDQELLIPRIIPKLVRSHDEAGQETTKGYFQVPSMQDRDRGVLNVARYKSGPGNPVMYELTLIERNEKYQPVSMVVAPRADWNARDESWTLTEGKRIGGLLPGGRRTLETVKVYKSNITPEEVTLHRSGQYVEYLSTARIDELLERKESFGELALQRTKHWRRTQWAVNMIMLLLAIPCVLSRQPTALRASATKCLVLTGLCLAAAFVGQQLAGKPPSADLASSWPAIMAWMPILVFGPIAVFLLDRVET